jgi:osmotically-inducible protein OsmY
MVQDTHVRDDIERELFYSCRFNPASIGVSVEDGIATLTGTVHSYEEKLVALRAAARIPQVRAIACQIEVRLPGPISPTDTDLARRAANVLACDSTVPQDRIRILVENGWVTLQGTVESEHQRSAVARGVSEIAGVKGVDNLVAVNAALDAERIKEQIEAALAASVSIEDRNILVEVKNDSVILHGEARSAGERDEAEKIAWSGAGVCDVANHILVANSVSVGR